MSGILGGIEGIVGDVLGGASGGGGGDFLSELMSMVDGGGQSQSQSGNSTMGEIGQIAGDVLPLLAML